MSMTFFVPVTVKWDDAELEITTVRGALQFLREWPASRRGPAFSCAERSCHAAIAGQVSVEATRQAFASFARISGILAGHHRGQTSPLAGRSSGGRGTGTAP